MASDFGADEWRRKVRVTWEMRGRKSLRLGRSGWPLRGHPFGPSFGIEGGSARVHSVRDRSGKATHEHVGPGSGTSACISTGSRRWEARQIVDAWRSEDNTERSRRALG
jgi:hypothetical protein